MADTLKHTKAGSTPGEKGSKGSSLLLAGIAIVVAAFPMFINLGNRDAEEPFAGTDAAAEGLVEEVNPEYDPWFDPLIGELPGEVESGLFALQAALGASVLGYAIGVYRGRTKEQERTQE